MKVLEKQARTVDEAVQLALDELGVSRDEVEVEVIDEGNKGILSFLSKPAKVKVTVKPKPEEVAVGFLNGLLHFIDKNAKVKCLPEDEILKLEIESEDAGILIGKHGSTLDALQYLTSLVVNKNCEDFVRIVLDAENYREKREDTLEHLALKIADKVKETKKSVMLEPMYPNERRIIHTTLQKDRKIVTKSVGKEPYRRVIISLK